MMFQGYHFQNAYITRNFEKGIETLTARGVREHLRTEADMEVKTRNGTARMSNRIFFGWVGDLQYEVIQPVVDEIGFYTEALPADDSLRFHHVCMRVDDWASFRGSIDEQRLVMEAGHDKLRFCYLDARDIVGHYLEFNWLVPEMWAAVGGSPDRAPRG
jgi:hypothetical protein